MKCIICDFEGEGKVFSNHVKKEHDLSSKDYTIKYIYKNKVGCLNCGDETRYVSFQFKKYCKACSKIGMSKGGMKGGKHESWNKGKTKETDSRIKSNSGKDNPFWGKKHNLETKNKISISKRLDNSEVFKRIFERNDSFEILTPLEEYISRQKQYLEFKCKKCDFISFKTLQAFERGSLCPKCFPLSKSKGEIEVYDFVKSIYFNEILSGARNVISPKEIDIYLKNKNFGIEFNGLYWHSDAIDNTTKYDLKKKTELCKEKGIKLMHIFSDEWEFKKEICKSMIKNRIGLCEKIYARNCIVKDLETKQFNDFMNKNHIDGKVNSSRKIGLFYNNELVCAIGFRKPRQKKWSDCVEISRFATKLNNVVVGGLSKLLKYYTRDMESYKILTYAELRFGEGLAYKKAGFKYIGDTGLNYWYSDGINRFNRFTMKSDEKMSEIERVNLLKMYKVWGCGNNIWLLEK